MFKSIYTLIMSLFRTPETFKIPAADPEKPSRRKPKAIEHDETESDGPDSAPLSAGEPAWLALARLEDGTVEVAGKGNNPRIVRYYAESGHPQTVSDETAWCAAFVGSMLHRAGYPNTGSLMAKSYLKYGEPCDLKVGAICVMDRGNDKRFGHVGFVVGYDHANVFVLGGNQWNQKTRRSEIVNVGKFPRSKIIGYRWPPSLKRSGVVHGLSLSGAGETMRQGAEPTADLLSSMGLELKGLAGMAPKLAAIGAVLVVLGLIYAFYARRSGMKQHGI